MTNAAALAARLRELPDDELIRLVVARRLPTAALGTSGPQAVADFFDLAEALRTSDAVDAAIERLPRATLLALRDGDGTPADLAPAAALGLVDDTGDVDDVVAARLAAHPDLSGLRLGGPSPADRAPRDDERPPSGSETPPSDDETPPSGSETPPSDAETPPSGSETPPSDSDARAIGAEQAFGTMTALAELLRAVDDGAVRELAKGGIGAPLARQLAERSGAPVDAVPGRLDLLDRVDFVHAADVPWTIAPAGRSWLAAPWPERWAGLVARWHDRTDPEVLAVLRAAGDDWSDLVTIGRWAYPAGARWLDAALLDVAGTAGALGLTVDGRLTATGRTLLGAADDDRDAAAPAREAVDAAREDLPDTVDAVYLQNDLTVIAPGPLGPVDDAALRTVADLEAPGLAARYRISEDTVRRALRGGHEHDDLLAMLDRLSATGVPQPLRYLVDQVAARDGSIVVHDGPDGRGAVVRGTPDQLDLIGVDAELRHLGWDRTDLTSIATSIPAPVVTTALEEQRYPAVLASGAAGREQTVPPGRRRPAPRSPEAAVRALVERLRVATQRGEAEPEQEWLGRQIDLAVRGRTPVRITVRMPDGTEQPFSIVPTSVAAGRVRGKDTSVDVERTLPLSLVVSVDSDA